jgi:hypothetical protein
MEHEAPPTASLAADDGPETTGEPTPIAIGGPSAFSSIERLVLDTLGEAASMTTGQLRVQTGLTPAELASALDSLRTKGVVARLNTVVESYRSRFPGVSLDPE